MCRVGDDSDLIVTWLPKAILVYGALYTEECKGVSQHRRVRLKSSTPAYDGKGVSILLLDTPSGKLQKKKSHLYIQLYSERVCNLDSINFQT